MEELVGPLAGLRVVELAGLGPSPHACMVLADLGADVVRVERPGTRRDPNELVLRHRRRVEADLKDAGQLADVLDLVAAADVLVEGFRPGVAERLGIGPAECLARNPRLVYARVTGWGQNGPLAHAAGHDLNYIAATGILAAIGRGGQPPAPPLNVIGDYGGGSMLALTGILAALWHVQRTGAGQAIDVAMVDGAVLLTQLFWSMRASGDWDGSPGTGLLNGGHPYYDTYVCADGAHIAVGAVEPVFYRQLLEGLGLEISEFPQDDETRYDEYRARFADVFATRTQEEWVARFEELDACVSPVRTFGEAPWDPHLAARHLLVEVDGRLQAAPAPRFDATPARPPAAPSIASERLDQVLRAWRG